MGGGDSWIPEDSAPAAGLSGEAWSITQESPDPPTDENTRYERRGLLGEGGMGQVYVARDRRLRREVAYKVAKDPKQARAMMREAWVTAQLEHPGIVPVYNAGETEEGQLYYTMRLVRGRSLELTMRACTQVSQRLELLPHFLDVCQAMAYAHSLGIVHRDLKPANILLGEFGETQVADWGLARPMLDPEGQWEEGPHRPGSGVMGTPKYMAPEQARGERVDPRADVWALGMVLLELASGRGPFQSSSGEDTLKRLREGRLQDLDPLLEPLPHELQAIARKCLQLHPQDRYPSARELAQDMARYLRGGRVQAHEYTPAELLGRLVRAWRAPLTVGLAAVAVLIGLALLSSQRIKQERDLAKEALAQGDLNLSLALALQAQQAQAQHARPEAEILAAHSLRYGENPLARGVLAAYARSPRPALKQTFPLDPLCQSSAQPSPDASMLFCSNEDTLKMFTLPGLELLWESDEGTQRAKWTEKREVFILTLDHQVAYLDGQTGAERLRTESPPYTKAISLPDGTVMVAALDFGFPITEESAPHLNLKHSESWKPLVAEYGHPLCPHASAGVPVGDRVLMRCDDGTLEWLNPDGSMSGEVLAKVPQARPFLSSAVQGELLLLGNIAGLLMAVDLNTGEVLSALEGLDTSALSIKPVPGSESLALVLGERGGPRLWNTAQGTWEGSLPGHPQTLAAGAAPGEVLLFGEQMEIWQLPVTSGATVLRHEHGLTAVAVDPQGMYVAASDGSGALWLREAGSGQTTDRFLPTPNKSQVPGVTKALSFSADGSELAWTGIAASNPTRLRGRWQASEKEIPVLRRVGALNDGSFWGAHYGRSPSLLPPEGGRLWLKEIPESFEGESSPDGSHVVLLSLQRQLWWVRAQDREVTEGFSVPTGLSVAIDNEAERLWVGNTLGLCRYDTEGVAQSCRKLTSAVVELSLSPDQALLAAGLANGEVSIFTAQTLEQIALLRGHTHRTATVDWAPTSDWLVSGSWDKTLRYWDLRYQHSSADELVAELEQAWSMDLERALKRD